jgi:hypothetical protein
MHRAGVCTKGRDAGQWIADVPLLMCFSYSALKLSFQPLIGGAIVAMVLLQWYCCRLRRLRRLRRVAHLTRRGSYSNGRCMTTRRIEVEIADPTPNQTRRPDDQTTKSTSRRKPRTGGALLHGRKFTRSDCHPTPAPAPASTPPSLRLLPLERASHDHGPPAFNLGSQHALCPRTSVQGRPTARGQR